MKKFGLNFKIDIEIVFDDKGGDYATKCKGYMTIVTIESGISIKKCMFDNDDVNESIVNGLQLVKNEKFMFSINKNID